MFFRRSRLLIYLSRLVIKQVLSVPDEEDFEIERDRTDMVMFMPFIHWETDIARLQQHYIMSDVDDHVKTGKLFTDVEIGQLPCSIDEKLLRTYLWHPSPVHIRRTLDQSFHYTLDDTKARDRDQVVLRYARQNYSEGRTSPRVLMVDQCWLWVIGSRLQDLCYVQAPVTNQNHRYCDHLSAGQLDRG